LKIILNLLLLIIMIYTIQKNNYKLSPETTEKFKGYFKEHFGNFKKIDKNGL